jgi:type I restriction enzyme, S subunit
LVPLERQDEIVAEIEKQFSRLDEAVANLQRVKANLKRYKASVLKAAVEGRLVETEASLAHREGRNYESGDQLLQHILEARRTQWTGRGKYKEPEVLPVASRIELPKGWVWVTLEQLHLQIADVDHKMPKAQADGIPYVSTKDFFGDEDINFAGAKRISTGDYEALCRKVKPEFGDVLLSRYGTVGEVRVVTVDTPFQASYSVAILKPVRKLVPIRFLTAALRSEAVSAQIKRDVRATAQPDLGLAHIRQLVVPLPPLSEQLRARRANARPAGCLCHCALDAGDAGPGRAGWLLCAAADAGRTRGGRSGGVDFWRSLKACILVDVHLYSIFAIQE